MQIETERLVLRPLGPADLPTVHRYASDPENARYMFFGLKQTEADTAAFLAGVEAEWKKEAPSFYEFALTLDGVQFGAVGLYLNDSRTEGELGWILDRRYQGKGYALEGAKAVVNFAFWELGLSALVAHCDTRNAPSFRLMERLGMERVAVGPRHYPQTGEESEEFTYRLCRPD